MWCDLRKAGPGQVKQTSPTAYCSAWNSCIEVHCFGPRLPWEEPASAETAVRVRALENESQEGCLEGAWELWGWAGGAERRVGGSENRGEHSVWLTPPLWPQLRARQREGT